MDAAIRTANQSSAAVGSFAVAADPGIVTDKLEQMITQDPEPYVTIFDKIWLFGINGHDTVQLVGLVVLVLTGISAYKNIFRKKEA